MKCKVIIVYKKEIKNPFSFNTIGNPDTVLLKFIFIEILSLSNNF